MGGKISELEPVLEEMKKNGSFEKVKQRALEHLREDVRFSSLVHVYDLCFIEKKRNSLLNCSQILRSI